MTFDEFVLLVEKHHGKVVGKPKVWKSSNVTLKSTGTNFKFASDAKVDGLSLTDYGGNNTIIIGSRSKLTGIIKVGKSCSLIIGNDFSCTGGMKLHLSEQKDIVIGNGCMFGVDISIYNHDYHPIFCQHTGNRINHSKNVIIRDNVWLANKVTVLKGVTIDSGAIIGIGSVVSSDIEGSSIAVGIPAKVVKRNVIWNSASFNTTHQDGLDNISEVYCE
ncbi:acyltransferase [Escherichia coli]|nr:acyltransferase [Escherichia coli]